jgi:hypothetical protein
MTAWTRYAAIESTVPIARGLEARVGQHELSREQAPEAFHDDIRAIRFDHGDGDGYVSDADARTRNVVMHGVNPALEGKSTPADTAGGRPIGDIVLEAVRTVDSGIATRSGNSPSGTSSSIPALTSMT